MTYTELCVAQLHWSTANYQPFQEGALWEGLADIYDAGLCEAVGISNYGPLQLQKVSARMKERDVPIAIAQVQYSLMTARNNEILDSCEDAGCRLISYSPLCLGLLSGKYDLTICLGQVILGETFSVSFFLEHSLFWEQLKQLQRK